MLKFYVYSRIKMEYYEIEEKRHDRERENAFTKGIMQTPKTCKNCNKRLMDFYKKFYCNWNPIIRKQMIEKMWKSRCSCRKK